MTKFTCFAKASYIFIIFPFSVGVSYCNLSFLYIDKLVIHVKTKCVGDNRVTTIHVTWGRTHDISDHIEPIMLHQTYICQHIYCYNNACVYIHRKHE